MPYIGRKNFNDLYKYFGKINDLKYVEYDNSTPLFRFRAKDYKDFKKIKGNTSNEFRQDIDTLTIITNSPQTFEIDTIIWSVKDKCFWYIEDAEVGDKNAEKAIGAKPSKLTILTLKRVSE